MQQLDFALKQESSEGQIACCECGISINPNPINMCLGCVRSRVDITEGILKQAQLQSCRNCSRYYMPPNSWIYAELESKELMSVCLGRLKSTMQKVRLVDAAFIWTEPHSKRVKLKLTIQKEVFSKAVLQQSFVVEFVLLNQMCDECRRFEAKDYWRACVQIRQRCDYKKTLFYLEQLLLKYKIQAKASSIKPVPTGLDLFFPRQQEARKLVDFVTSALPSKYQHSQQLITHDVRNNYYDYKHTFCIDIVPIIKDALVCLPKHLAQQYSNIGQFVICLRVTDMITLLNPATTQLHDVNSTTFWKDPFEILVQPKMLQEFFVIDVEEIEDSTALLPRGHGNVSNKHRLVDVWVVKSDQVGQSDAKTVFCRTHLGNLLSPGDTVLGYNVWESNLNSAVFDMVKEERVPDVVLVKKAYDKGQRNWKLKRLIQQEETSSVEMEFNEFMDDIGRDPKLREKINIYKETRVAHPSISMEEDEVENGPTLEEMLDDLDIEDVEMSEGK